MNPGYGSTCPEAAPVLANDSSNSNQIPHSFMGYSAHTQQSAMLQAIYAPQQSPSGPFSSRMSPYIWTNSTATSEVPYVSSGEATPLSHVFASRCASAVTPESQYSHFNIGRLQAGHDGDAIGGPNVAHALSLSLSPRHTPMQVPYYDNAQSDALASIPDLTYVVGDKRGDRSLNTGYATHFKGPSEGAMGPTFHNYMSDIGSRRTHQHVNVQPEVSSVGGFFTQSKYLRAVQHLLNEVVSVEDAIKQNNSHPKYRRTASWASHNPVSAGDVSGSMKGMGTADASTGGKDQQMAWGLSIEKSASCPDLLVTSSAVELTPQARQELQMKKANLISMLEKVDQRYKLYRSQMQAIVSLFESAAGMGAAQCYTALALQTISRHFRCLRDAIAGQVRAASKGLGEEEHLMHQRAFQHLHMMHQHAWRPQRGLPERAVSVLRAWLFEHFLHPYPKDADKVLLAKRTGLTRNQVSNWFINARVRLWKPMVEEMYQEEAKDGDMPVTEISNEETQKERDEMGVGSSAGQRGMDSNLLETLNMDHSTEEGKEREIHRQLSTAAALGQNTLVQGSVAAVDSDFSLHEWHGAKKARSLDESFAGRAELYPAIQTAEEKQSFMTMQGVNPQSFNPYLSNAGATRGGVLGSTTVSLTLGLQHRDPIEAPSQHQQQQLLFHHIDEPRYGPSHGILQHASQDLPEGLLGRASTGDAPTSQNYLSSMTGNSLEILSQLQMHKQLHGPHGLHSDFAS